MKFINELNNEQMELFKLALVSSGKAIVFGCIVFLSVFFTSCQKNLPYSCYDEAFHRQHKNDICTQDCPGVIGCDGKNYCNECIMHSHGIKKTK